MILPTNKPAFSGIANMSLINDTIHFKMCVISAAGGGGITGFILGKSRKWSIEIKEFVYNSKGISDIDT